MPLNGSLPLAARLRSTLEAMLADAVLDGLSDNGVASLMEAGRLKLEGWAGGTAILVREEWLSHS